MQAWARLVSEAQRQAGLFPRDGKLLKPVPVPLRLLPQQLQAHLLAAHKQPDVLAESRQQFLAAWSQGESCWSVPLLYFQRCCTTSDCRTGPQHSPPLPSLDIPKQTALTTCSLSSINMAQGDIPGSKQWHWHALGHICRLGSLSSPRRQVCLCQHLSRKMYHPVNLPACRTRQHPSAIIESTN